MTTLYLINMETTASDIIDLLTIRMPNLQHVRIDEIKLLEGRWEGVIECMKQSMHLSSFPLPSHVGLYRLEGQNFMGEIQPGIGVSSEEVEN